MRILLTGTGTPIPSAVCAGPGTCVYVDGLVLQFDVGRGTVMRLAASGVQVSDVDAVFLTHYHHDHVTDLADLALTRWSVKEKNGDFVPLSVYAPRGPCSVFARTVLLPYFGDMIARQTHGTSGDSRGDMPLIEVHTFDPSPSNPLVVYISPSGLVRVSAIAVEHDPVENAVAYSVDARHDIDTESCHVVISGDTRECDAVAKLIVRGVSTVVHEAILLGVGDNRRSGGIAEYHADASKLARQMADNDVTCLILTHLIPEASTEKHREIWESVIRDAGYCNELHIGYDGLMIDC